MKTNTITYSDTELRNLVEEYITQQKNVFTLKGVCSYVLYWAVEDGKVVNNSKLIEGYELNSEDQERVIKVLDAIITDGRITVIGRGEYQKQ